MTAPQVGGNAVGPGDRLEEEIEIGGLVPGHQDLGKFRRRMEGVKFYTKVKTVTARWPEGAQEDSAFVIPTMG